MSTESCCPKDSWPALQGCCYVPKGEVRVDKKEGEKDMEVYVVGTAEEGKAVLVLPDIFGIDGGRNKHVADQLAQAGFLVVMPDYFLGDFFPIADSAEFGSKGPEWAARFPYEAHRAPLRRALDLIAALGVPSKVVTIGFCWGCWVSFHAGADEEFRGRIRGAVDCHPSLKLEEWIWKKSIDDLARAARAGFPHLLLSAANDPDFVREGGSVIGILNEAPGSKSRVVDFPGASHGWVNRGNIKADNVKRDVKRAIELAIAFYDEVLQ